MKYKAYEEKKLNKIFIISEIQLTKACNLSVHVTRNILKGKEDDVGI